MPKFVHHPAHQPVRSPSAKSLPSAWLSQGPAVGLWRPSEPGEPPRVCIVGAGAAGLACADELLKPGADSEPIFEVTIYEAQNRVGGRVWTHSGAGHSITERGAEWIGERAVNPQCWELADRYRLDLEPMALPRPGVVWIHDKNGSVKQLGPEDRYKLQTAYQETLKCMQQAAPPALSLAQTQALSGPAYAKLDAMSLAEWAEGTLLVQPHGRYDRQAVWTVLATMAGVAPEHANALSCLLSVGHRSDKPVCPPWRLAILQGLLAGPTDPCFFRCKQGNSALLEKLAAQIVERGGDIIFKSQVTRIDYTAAPRVTYRTLGDNDVLGRPQQSEDQPHFVVATAAPFARAGIDFVPESPLPCQQPQLAHASKRTGWPGADKDTSPYVFFDWNRGYPISMGCPSTHVDAGPPEGPPRRSGYTEYFLHKAPDAREPIEHMAKAVRLEQATVDGVRQKKIIGPLGLQAHLVRSLVPEAAPAATPDGPCWAGMPFIGAAYTSFAPKELGCMAPALCSGYGGNGHYGALRFAGDDLFSPCFGSMEAALVSGRFAAQQIKEHIAP